MRIYYRREIFAGANGLPFPRGNLLPVVFPYHEGARKDHPSAWYSPRLKGGGRHHKIIPPPKIILRKGKMEQEETWCFYKTVAEIKAIQMDIPFHVITDKGITLHGKPGDYLVMDPQTEDNWIVPKDLFEVMYTKE